MSLGHPRACGENVRIRLAQLPPNGPSPRVRGELRGASQKWWEIPGHPRACGENSRCRHRSQAVERAIPARAGRTSASYRFSARACGPSPRVRGELSAIQLQCNQLTGSSPRVRGERTSDRLRAPSCMGHPRACGENGTVSRSPVAIVWAIPARAGRTISVWISWLCSPGPSPRVRGERGAAGRRHSSTAGPSPRVRGEPTKWPERPPESAGHPRACGENYCTLPMERRPCRAIPARAGRTVRRVAR